VGTGQLTLVDLRFVIMSGLREVRRILEHVQDLKFFDFTQRDVVRHPLVAKIVTAYEIIDREKEKAAAE
jgi:phosphate starvation-inducible PhoH-like protein